MHATWGCARFDDARPKTWHMIFPVRCGAGIDADGLLELMKFFGNEMPDPVRPLLQGVVEVAPGAARGQAVALLNRYDMLKHTSESLCSNPFGALLWWSTVDELLAEGQDILGFGLK